MEPIIRDTDDGLIVQFPRVINECYNPGDLIESYNKIGFFPNREEYYKKINHKKFDDLSFRFRRVPCRITPNWNFLTKMYENDPYTKDFYNGKDYSPHYGDKPKLSNRIVL